MLRSAEKMLKGQHQRVRSSAYATSAHKGLLQKKEEEEGKKKRPITGSLLNRLSCPLDDPIGQGTELN